MENLETLVQLWRGQPPQQVTLGKLKTDPAYQPRNHFLAPYKDRTRLVNESEAHIARLADRLALGDLDPLLAAQIEGKLFIVDGHHRLKAYKRVGRGTVPVHVLPMSAEQAGMASKLVNCSGVKLAMHSEQSRECAWQTLAVMTRRARQRTPEGFSARAFALQYGTTKDTVCRMLKRLPEVNPKEYQPEACDCGTGWPQWKNVKGNATRDRYDDVPLDTRERHRDEQRAAKVAAMIDKDGVDAFLRSITLLRDEAVTEAATQLAEVMPGDPLDY